MAARKNIDWSTIPLGRMSDNEIASILGIRSESVGQARRRLGIEPMFPFCRPVGINWDEQPLGEVSDAVIVRELVVSQAAVYAARKRRGIPIYKPVKGE